MIDDKPNIEVGDFVRLVSQYDKRIRLLGKLYFRIVGFRGFDTSKDVVLIEPVNGIVEPGECAPYGWTGKEPLSVSSIDIVKPSPLELLGLQSNEG